MDVDVKLLDSQIKELSRGGEIDPEAKEGLLNFLCDIYHDLAQGEVVEVSPVNIV